MPNKKLMGKNKLEEKRWLLFNKKNVDFSILKGKTIIEIISMRAQEDEIIFKCSDGTSYKMYHDQQCCENVWLEDVVGEVDNLLDTPILNAELTVDSQKIECGWQTYSYYHLATIKGYVDLRWCGESNGCYSEEVDFIDWSSYPGSA